MPFIWLHITRNVICLCYSLTNNNETRSTAIAEEPRVGGTLY